MWKRIRPPARGVYFCRKECVGTRMECDQGSSERRMVFSCFQSIAGRDARLGRPSCAGEAVRLGSRDFPSDLLVDARNSNEGLLKCPPQESPVHRCHGTPPNCASGASPRPIRVPPWWAQARLGGKRSQDWGAPLGVKRLTSGSSRCSALLTPSRRKPPAFTGWRIGVSA